MRESSVGVAGWLVAWRSYRLEDGLYLSLLGGRLQVGRGDNLEQCRTQLRVEPQASLEQHLEGDGSGGRGSGPCLLFSPPHLSLLVQPAPILPSPDLVDLGRQVHIVWRAALRADCKA